MNHTELNIAISNIDEKYFVESCDFKGISSSLKAAKKKRIGIFLSVCSCFVFCFIAIGIMHSGVISKKPANTPEKDITNISTEPTKPIHEEQIQMYINEVAELPGTDRNYICLLGDDFIKLTAAELCDYYGKNVFPTVPDDLKNWDSASDFAGYGIYRRNNGTGEMYNDVNILNYSNSDFSRNVNIEVTTMPLIFIDFLFDRPEYKKSVIMDTEIFIDKTNNGYYFVEWSENNIEFFINADGLSESEFVSVVKSLIK